MAMISYGLLKLARLQILPNMSRSVGIAACAALNDRDVRNGVVTSVSGGTSPRGIAVYREIPVGSETWGTGAYLLAVSEAARTQNRISGVP
jgi:hypothetical protein